MSKRTVLLGLLLGLSGAIAFGQAGVGAGVAVAPTSSGDIGLLTMPTADNPRAGQFTLGMYGWLNQRVAAPLFQGDPDQIRTYRDANGEISVGLGLTNWWSVFASGGLQERHNRGSWERGIVNGIPLVGPFDIQEGRKLRVGTKFNFHSEADYDLRFAGWLAAHIPVSNATIDIDEQGTVTDVLNSRRADWEWGAAVTKSIFTGMVSYTLAGRHDEDIRPANDLRFGFGVDVPVMPFLHIIAEIDRHVLDGGDDPEPDYSMLNLGGRFWIGHTGWAVSGALNTNMDMLFKHGVDPAPFGGVVGITYAAWPPAPPPPVVVPPAEAVAEPAPPVETTPAAPAPAPPPPPRPAPRTTSDEIFFDGKSARLTNIAKAVLDGVALRMKNDLNATAVIAGYTDNSGTEKANQELGQKRADAAKEYLVTRHGIDPGRISTQSKGSSEPAYDNASAEGKAKNRRAQIVVTLVSGT
jgi:outer membrane protein OmpA-like peptidoglycan-associated protein